MRVEKLNESVQIRADFKGGTISPILMRRGDRKHRVESVNGRWVDREGESTRYFFAITTDSGDVFQLFLRTQDMTWHLAAVMLE